MTRATMVALLALMALLFFAAPSATAQGYAPPGGQKDAGPVTDAMLEEYAEASSNVRSVQQEFSAKIQSTQDPSEAQALRARAQREMTGAVESAGLSVAEYNRITQQLQQDRELAERLAEVESD